jgi:hypothetical protein
MMFKTKLPKTEKIQKWFETYDSSMTTDHMTILIRLWPTDDLLEQIIEEDKNKEPGDTWDFGENYYLPLIKDTSGALN